MERFVRPKRSTAEQELVNRAKKLLMERKGLSEDEAHRTLQKRSMDAGSRLTQTARQVIAELENRPAE